MAPTSVTFAYTRQVVDYQTNAVAPAFIEQANGNTFNIVLNDPNNAGSYNFKILATEPLSGLIDDSITFALVLYYCQPASIILTPSSVTVSILGPSTTITWSKEATNAACGTYSALPASTNDFVITNNGNQITVSVPATATTGTYSPVVTVQRDDNIV